MADRIDRGTTPRQDVFTALADPTRRGVLESLIRDGATTATELGRRLPVTRQAVGKHLGVLAAAGLVRSFRVGREARYEPVPDPLAAAADWLVLLASAWDDRLTRLAAPAEAPNPDRSLRRS